MKATKDEEDERILEFHRQRRMFAVVKGVLKIAPAGAEYDHETWSRYEGWGREASFESVLRGFVDATGIYTYRGSDYAMSALATGDLAEHADLLAFLVGNKLETPIWNGMQPGAPGERWKPTRLVCTLGELLTKRETVMIPVRLRPEVLERLRKALGDDEAVTRFVRRAVATGGEEKTLDLLRAECAPHDGVKLAAGQQSSELFECKRCGAQWWD
jgi:hypothetical protein